MEIHKLIRKMVFNGVEIPESIMTLVEELAENVHDTWAAERRRQGWTYGPVRDDAAKKHPCLVPYGSLPENERIFDRKTALETLSFILKKGYKIEKRQ